MTIELETLTKDEIKQIKEFPKDIENKLHKIMSIEQASKIMQVVKFNRKEDIKFLTELNKNIKSINTGTIKYIHLLSWYLIKKEILDKENLNMNIDTEFKIHVYLHKVFTGKKYIDKEGFMNLKEWLFETITSSIENTYNNKIFGATLYLDSYTHWLLLIDTLVDILKVNKLLKENGVEI